MIKDKLKEHAKDWLRCNMNDGDENLEVCTLHNYKLSDLYIDIEEMIDDFDLVELP